MRTRTGSRWRASFANSRRAHGRSTASTSRSSRARSTASWGPNGAGKSTTVHMLTTLLPPTAGTARVAGHDVVREGPAVRDAIGVALQEAALDPFLTAREHMRLQAGMHGLPRSEAERRGDQLIDRVGLSDAADRKVGGYSGGMKRRLDLALALVHEPRLLFLDEPTTGLDVQSRTALWDEVTRLAHQHGVTVFLTTQYLEEADALAQRVAIIDIGKIVAQGTPDSLKAEIGRPTVEAVPTEIAQRDAMRDVLGRFGTDTAAGARRRRGPPRRRHRGAGRGRSRAGRCADQGREPGDPRAHTGRRVPGEDRQAARGRRRGRGAEAARGGPAAHRGARGGRRVSAGAATVSRHAPARAHRHPHAGRPPREALGRAHRPPAGGDRLEHGLPAVPPGDQRVGAGGDHRPARASPPTRT